MEDDIIEVTEEDVKSAISEELASIIKQRYGVDIFTMDRKQLGDFLSRVLVKKRTLLSRTMWWGAAQVSTASFKLLVPLILLAWKI